MVDANFKRLIIFVNFLALVFFSFDRITKKIFLFSPASLDYLILPNLLELKLSKNPNLALGIRLVAFWQYLLIFLAIFVIIYFIIKAYRSKKMLLIFSLTLILVGAFSNLWDRICYGYIIDFINFSFFSVFNLADIYITCGIFLILFSQFKKSNIV